MVKGIPNSVVESYYYASANQQLQFPTLSECIEADVCVIGGGFTGLSTALHLAEKNFDVVLLEAHTVGWGASGRNGGQCARGQRMDQQDLHDLVGRVLAHELWEMSEQAVRLVLELVERFSIDCDLKVGVLQLSEKQVDAQWYEQYVDYMQEYYHATLRFVDGPELAYLSGTNLFRGGCLDEQSYHLHPLNFALGLAKAADTLGVRIYEGSRVVDLNHESPTTVSTKLGQVKAPVVVLACNGYLGHLERKIAGNIMPINNFMIATEPLSDRWQKQVNPADYAMHDSRFIVNYWKLSSDGRMLFGGGENYRPSFPRDIRSIVRRYFLGIYPQLAHAAIDYAWGGTLAVTTNRLPSFGRIAPDIYYAMGFSGHGVPTGTFAGYVIANAIEGTTHQFDVFANLPVPAFPGGILLRWPLLTLGMLYYAIQDRI